MSRRAEQCYLPGATQMKTATSNGDRFREPHAKEFGMGDTANLNPKTPQRSNARKQTSGELQGYHQMLSATEQRTFCGCRGITIDFPWSDNACPLGFPWLCGGIPASELDEPPPCNTGVSPD